jgi:hypothetical protein
MEVIDHNGTARMLPVWEKWESGNPAWRPKSTIRLEVDKLTEKWIKIPTKDDIQKIYLAMLSTWVEKIKELEKDDQQPILIRSVARSLLEWRWLDIIEKMLDRSIGKAEASIEHKWDITITARAIREMPSEKLAELIEWDQ